MRNGKIEQVRVLHKHSEEQWDREGGFFKEEVRFSEASGQIEEWQGKLLEKRRGSADWEGAEKQNWVCCGCVFSFFFSTVIQRLPLFITSSDWWIPHLRGLGEYEIASQGPARSLPPFVVVNSITQAAVFQVQTSRALFDGESGSEVGVCMCISDGVSWLQLGSVLYVVLLRGNYLKEFRKTNNNVFLISYWFPDSWIWNWCARAIWKFWIQLYHPSHTVTQHSQNDSGSRPSPLSPLLFPFPIWTSCSILESNLLVGSKFVTSY